MHEEVAGCYEQCTEEEGEEHAVAENLLSPSNIFATKHNAHSRRSTCTYERTKGMDDVHDGQGDGQGGKNESAIGRVTKENAVHQIVYSGNDLSHHSWKCVLPE